DNAVTPSEYLVPEITLPDVAVNEPPHGRAQGRVYHRRNSLTAEQEATDCRVSAMPESASDRVPKSRTGRTGCTLDDVGNMRAVRRAAVRLNLEDGFSRRRPIERIVAPLVRTAPVDLRGRALKRRRRDVVDRTGRAARLAGILDHERILVVTPGRI